MAMRTRIRRKVRRTRPAVRRTPSGSANAARTDAKQAMGGHDGLMIGGVQDPAEKAADRAADRVMNTQAPAPVTSQLCTTCGSNHRNVHRKCTTCEAETKTVKRQAAEEEEVVQTKASSKAAPVAPGSIAAPASAPASKAIHSMGAGKPLSGTDRAFFEPRMNTDLSNVRVHDGPAADKAASGINARAFAYKNNVAFARGERKEGTNEGTHLMAHELAHVVGEGGGQGPVHRKIQTEIKGKPDNIRYKISKDYGVKGTSRSGNEFTLGTAIRSGSLNKEIASSMLASTRTFKLAGTGLHDAEASLRDHLAARRSVIKMAKKIRVKFSLGDEILEGVLKFVSDEAKKAAVDDVSKMPNYSKMTKAEIITTLRKSFKGHIFRLMREKAGSKEFQAAAKEILKQSTAYDKAKKKAKVKPFASACFIATATVVYGGGGPVQEQSVKFDPADAVRDSTIWSDWVPGDWGYIRNPDAAPALGVEGENIVSIGREKFWAHFPGSKGRYSLEQLVNEVASWNAADTFVLMPTRKYPKKGLL